MIVMETYCVALAALMFVVSLLGLPSADMAARTASVIQIAFGIGLIGVVMMAFR